MGFGGVEAVVLFWVEGVLVGMMVEGISGVTAEAVVWICVSFEGVQTTPSPANPLLQLHTKLPSVFKHFALILSQLLVFSVHSSTSDNK